jgi:hypothetical protein
MMRREPRLVICFRILWLILLTGSLGSARLWAQPPAPIPEELVKRLPAAYQDEARKLITADDVARRIFFNVADEEWTGLFFRLLAQKPAGPDFMKEQLEKEPSGVIRAQMLMALEKYMAQHPQDQVLLEKHISSDPDPTAALAALETLRRIKVASVGEVLNKRIKSSQGGDEAAANALRDAYISHYMWFGDVRLPDFAYTPPPMFEAKSSGQLVRALAFGDFGWGSGDSQAKSAAAMRAYHHDHPFDLGITLGDNFYGRGPFLFAERIGIASPDDPRWQTQYEQMYSPMGIKIYPSFGNADYIDPSGPAAEIAYTKKSKTWYFPAPYYTFTAGPVQFFSVDNIRLSDDELRWLDEALAKSKARWKVVYGHYHIYSSTETEANPATSRLLPILKKNSVDVWLNGHLHEMQELQPDGSVHFFVNGGAGAELSGPAKIFKGTRVVRHGFSVIEADDQHLDMIFIGDDGKEVSRSHITK